MSTLVKAWCTCGWHGEYGTQGLADYARRRHSCEKWQAKRRRSRGHADRLRAVDRTPKVCTHKVAQHQHGTYVMYTLDGCRCTPCRKAAGAYEQHRRQQRAYGREAYVDARPATAHVRELMAAGIGWKRVAVLAGIPDTNVYALLYGRPDRNGGAPRTRARRATVEALLAVPMPRLDDYAAGALVPTLGARRRLQALQAVGWSVQKIAERASLDRQALDKIMAGGERTQARTARAVRDAYDQLWSATPPVETAADKVARSRSLARAAAAGWPPPLAWDDESLDDPAARSITEESPDAGAEDRLEEWVFLVRSGEDRLRAASRCGWRTIGPIENAARRHERRDVLDLLQGVSA